MPACRLVLLILAVTAALCGPPTPGDLWDEHTGAPVRHLLWAAPLVEPPEVAAHFSPPPCIERVASEPLRSAERPRVGDSRGPPRTV